MKCHLCFEILLLASDKCQDLYLSIGRSIYLKKRGFWDNGGKKPFGAPNQRNLVVYKDVPSNKFFIHYFSAKSAGPQGTFSRLSSC